MQPLTIEYRTEGRQRGYDFTSSTSGYDDTTLKTVWRMAMPRGQGWADYVGARSLKCFPIDDRRLALSEVTVTDQQDESGRRGIRRAEVRVLYAEACAAYLRERLHDYPGPIQSRLARLPTPLQWATILKRTMPLVGRGQQQLVLTHAYDLDWWAVVEGVIIKLALALQVGLRRHNGVVSFTTLTLDPREEMALVGLPRALVGKAGDVSLLDL
jgi:hypothetical protein